MLDLSDGEGCGPNWGSTVQHSQFADRMIHYCIEHRNTIGEFAPPHAGGCFNPLSWSRIANGPLMMTAVA